MAAIKNAKNPQARKLFNLLSKEDAHMLFERARIGVEAEVGAWEDFGLSKKQYYTRIRQLVETELVEKRGEFYVQTAFGRAVYVRHVLGMESMLRNDLKGLRMVNVLENSGKFAAKEIEDVFSKLKKG